MAKCVVCNSRKGQRKCLKEDSFVCSQCCGETRRAELCQGCVFYSEVIAVRKYSEVPRFSTQTMDSNMELQSYSNSIEGTLCLIDSSHKMVLNDEFALKILRMLIDKYHFHDSDISCEDSQAKKGFDMVVKSITEDFIDVSEEVIVKILGVIHYVAKRRSQGGREYFNIIQQYVGLRAGSGMRALSNILMR